MQQINASNVETVLNKGYRVSKEEKIENYYKTEPHIYKQGPLTDIKAGAHKLTNDIFTYYPKGFSGSKNSNFYEYLSMGMVPYVVGGATLIGLSKAANKLFNMQDAASANKAARCAAAGVILYGAGKWLSKKLSRTLIHASTGVNLNMRYINKVVELPENGQEQGIIRTQYPGVFDSIEFYRNDLLKRDSELIHENIYHYDDKIARKAGYKEKLNSPEQEMGSKIRKLKARAGALENINQYIAAACGVALGAQKAVADAHIFEGFSKNGLKKTGKNIINTVKETVGQLWRGNDRSFLSRNLGKFLIIGTIGSVLIDWLIPTIGFKTKPETMKSKVNTAKEYEVG